MAPSKPALATSVKEVVRQRYDDFAISKSYYVYYLGDF